MRSASWNKCQVLPSYLGAAACIRPYVHQTYGQTREGRDESMSRWYLRKSNMLFYTVDISYHAEFIDVIEYASLAILESEM
jgi:hypothetical protein